MDRVEGRNPVREALRAGRPIRRILISRDAALRGPLAEIVASAKAAGVRVERVPRTAIEERASTGAHQGIVAEVDAFAYRPWRDGLALAAERGEPPMLLAIDRMTDPRNLGSLLRSAEVFGCHAVLLPERRTATMSPVVEKAAAGAVEHLVIDLVGSVDRALAACRKEGIWIVGLDGEAREDIGDIELLGEPVVIVVGAEGSGLSRLSRERADVLARIPMAGRTGSLSAPVAGALALYEARRRRVGRPG